MRELKFRTWNWLEGRFDKEPAVFITIGGELTPSNNRIIEQYTGLKDKNDKEICEGDILGGIWESGFISWCERCKQLQYHSAGIGCMACNHDVQWYELVDDDGKLEVIGNIHENPELLEGEK